MGHQSSINEPSSNLAPKIEVLLHHLDTVMVTGNNANRDWIILQRFHKILVGAGFGIFVRQVPRKNQQIQALHGLGIECLVKIGAYVNSLDEALVFPDMHIGNLAYL